MHSKWTLQASMTIYLMVKRIYIHLVSHQNIIYHKKQKDKYVGQKKMITLSGFPLFRTDKIPWYFHDFSRFFSKFSGIFFIIFKVWFPSRYEYKYANLLSFIWTKN